MQLGSGVAVVLQASSCRSNSTPSLGISTGRRCSSEKKKKEEGKKKKYGEAVYELNREDLLTLKYSFITQDLMSWQE